jgi:ADP-ribose pyrophosphatase
MDESDLAWETLDSELDYTCPGFDVVREDVRLPDGTDAEFHHVSEPPSVVVVPFTDDGEVVVIREWRQAVNRVNLGLPAGGLEPDDTDVLAAARRELLEETGHEPDGLDRIATHEPANGLFDSMFHNVVARGCTPTSAQRLDDNESIAVETIGFDELREQAASGQLRDGRSALAVLQCAAQAE